MTRASARVTSVLIDGSAAVVDEASSGSAQAATLEAGAIGGTRTHTHAHAHTRAHIHSHAHDHAHAHTHAIARNAEATGGEVDAAAAAVGDSDALVHDDDPELEELEELPPYTRIGPFAYRWDWRWQDRLRALARGRRLNALSSAALVFALFASDALLVAEAPPASVDGVEWSLFAVFVWFLLELAGITLIERKYFLSFYFWMDFVGTLSIIMDIRWMSEPIYEAFGVESGGQATVLRATRAARIGGRAGRLMRLVRVVRVLKFFRISRVLKGEADVKAEMSGRDAPSNIAKALSENISRQVATLVLLSVFVPMFLASEVVDTTALAYVNSLEAIALPQVAEAGAVDRASLQPLVDVFRRNFLGLSEAEHTGALPPGAVAGLAYAYDESYRCSGCGMQQKPFYLRVGDEVWGEEYFGRSEPAANAIMAVDGRNECPAARSEAAAAAGARAAAAAARGKEYRALAPCVSMRFDVSATQAEEGMWNILLVVFVILLLLAFSFMLNATSTRLVVRPIERIFRSIQMNAAQVMNSLALGHEGMEMRDMEAVVGKMTKLVKHVSGTGQQGDHMIKTMLDDTDMDDNTRDFIKQYSGDSAAAAHTSSPRRRRGGSIDLPSPDRGHGQAVGNGGGDAPAARDGEVSKAQVVATTQAFHDGAAGRGEARSVVSLSTSLDSWACDMEGLPTDEECAEHVMAMFDAFDLIDEMVHRDTLAAFIALMQQHYGETPYHNWRHVCDVTHAVYRYVSLTEDKIMPSPLEKFSLLVAALAHDLNHPGINNNFLVRTRDSKAIKYNDSSVLENHHVSMLYQLVADHPDADVFAKLDDAEWREARKLIIHTILHTDMVNHFKSLSQLEVWYELNTERVQRATQLAGQSDAECIFETPEERELIFSTILHAADISNPVRPMHIYKKWNMRVLEEFWQQGDREKARGLKVSPQMDRDRTSIPQSQIAFIDVIVAPLYKTMVLIFPELQATLATLCANRRELSNDRIDELLKQSTLDAVERAAERGKVLKELERFLEKYSPDVLLGPRDARHEEGHGVLNAAVRRISVTTAPSLFKKTGESSSRSIRDAGDGGDSGGWRRRASVFVFGKRSSLT